MNLQPNELRLGILVYDSLRQKNITIQLKHFRELSISDKTFFDRYKPIEISEELLLEMGFSWNESLERFIIGNYSSIQVCGNFVPEFSNSYFDDIKSIHQLQNLFHSIVGENLNC